MNENFVKPVNSHLVMFDKPKVGVVEGYIERVFGMLHSQHVDEYGAIVTNRTLLIGEELTPYWNSNSHEDEILNFLHFFNDFPNLTINDIKAVLRSACKSRGVEETFEELEKLGCIIPKIEHPITIYTYRNEENYNFFCEELGNIASENLWIPSSLKILYRIQDFLNIQIILVSDGDGTVEQSSIDMMNNLLENQRKYKVLITSKKDSNISFVNDGVYSYGINGEKIEMNREEFLKKYPNSYEL